MPLTEAEALEGILNVLNGTTLNTPVLAIRDHLAAIRAAAEAHTTVGTNIITAIQGMAVNISNATISQTEARQPLRDEATIRLETQSRSGAARSPGIPR